MRKINLQRASRPHNFLGFGRPLGGEAGENDQRRKSKKVKRQRRRNKIARASRREQRR